MGVRSGDHVGMLMKNCAQYVELLYACWAIGACAIPINARLHAREVAYILDDARARLCFVTTEAEAAAIDAARTGGTPDFIDVDGGDYRRCCSSRRRCRRAAESSVNESAWLFYTSGTTGRPKGVDPDAPQPAGDDAELPRRRRPRRRSATTCCMPRRCRTAPASTRFRTSPSGATQLIPARTRLRRRRDPADPRLHAGDEVLRRADDGDAAGRRLCGTRHGAGAPEVDHLRRRADVRRRQRARARCARTAPGADLRPGRVADDDHGADGRRTHRRPRWAPRRAPGLGRPRAGRRRGHGAGRARPARCRPTRSARSACAATPSWRATCSNPQATAEALRRRLAAHRRPRPLRRRGLPDAGRPQQGPHHLRRIEHLSARGRGSAADAPGREGSRRHRRTAPRMGRGRRRRAGRRKPAIRRTKRSSTSSASSASPASSGRSAMCSSTSCRRTRPARC